MSATHGTKDMDHGYGTVSDHHLLLIMENGGVLKEKENIERNNIRDGPDPDFSRKWVLLFTKKRWTGEEK